MGEGSSFLGDTVENKVRLTGVLTVERDCLLRAGDKHALASFSPKMRRPSLAGLHWIEVACILEVVELPEVGGVTRTKNQEPDQTQRSLEPWRGSGLGEFSWR